MTRSNPEKNQIPDGICDLKSMESELTLNNYQKQRKREIKYADKLESHSQKNDTSISGKQSCESKEAQKVAKSARV